MTDHAWTLQDVVDFLAPNRHRFDLYQDAVGVAGKCHCGVSFSGVTEVKDLFDLVRDHCEPIAA